MWILFFQVVLSEEMQTLVVIMLKMAEALTDMMDTILPTIKTLQSYLLSIRDLNLVANNEFNQVCTLYFFVGLYTDRIHVRVYVCVITQLTPTKKQGIRISL